MGDCSRVSCLALKVVPFPSSTVSSVNFRIPRSPFLVPSRENGQRMAVRRLGALSIAIGSSRLLALASVWRHGDATRSQTTGLSSVSGAHSSLYDVLGVSVDATPEQIKDAYRRGALACHPDVAPADERTTAEAAFRRLSEAYRTLQSNASRSAYDISVGLKGAVVAPLRRRSASPVRRPTVRKDADAVFADVFEGQSIHDILFRASFAKKFGRAVGRPGETVTSVPQGVQTSQSSRVKNDGNSGGNVFPWSGNPHGFESASLRLDRERASSHRRRPVRAPFVPPSPHMPFPPFPGMAVPANVTTEPTVPPAPQPVEGNDMRYSGSHELAHDAEEPVFSPVASWQLNPAERDSYYRMQRLNREVALPHNSGQLYSYLRPY